MRFHIHRDPSWEIIGANAYYQCRCGARCVAAYYSNLAGPTTPGWPHLVDRHGRSIRRTRWVPEPDGGWPSSSHRCTGRTVA